MDATTSTSFDFSKQFFFAVAVCCLGWYVLSAADWTVQNVQISLVGGESKITEAAPNKARPVALGSSDDPNSAAPRSSGQITDEIGNAYIERYGPLAQQEMQRYNIPASIQLAQALIECTGGTSTGARKAKNHFGIKCFAKKHRYCCLKAHDDSNQDGFVVYETEWHCWRAHSKLLAGPRYRGLIGQDVQGWANGLQRLGYATDKGYAKKLMAMVNRFDLTRFDQ